MSENISKIEYEMKNLKMEVVLNSSYTWCNSLEMINALIRKCDMIQIE